MKDQTWRLKAACRGMDGINQPDFLRLREEAKKKICRGCSVRYACLDFALEVEDRPGVDLLALNERVGIVYGGLNGAELRQLIYRRRDQALVSEMAQQTGLQPSTIRQYLQAQRTITGRAR